MSSLHDTSSPSARSRLRIAVDIGGTFTDMAAFDEVSGRLLFGKALSTHGQLVNGIQATIDSAQIDWRDGHLFLHGSTIAINTLLERNGAHTALLITEGFRDIYEIGRVNRPDAYNLFFNKHQPLVRRSLRFEVAERACARTAVCTSRSMRPPCVNWPRNFAVRAWKRWPCCCCTATGIPRTNSA